MDSNHRNQTAWNQGAYDAWLQRFGEPSAAARKLAEQPESKVGPVFQYMGKDVRGKKIANLLGSNGYKAVALALLGAQVTVVDFSAGNERYARELAAAAGVSIEYLLSDVLHLPEQELSGDYDIVFMEMGILHYFLDLAPLFAVICRLLKQGGTFIVHDFHPVSTKLISSRGTTASIRKHKVTGDYFDESLEEQNISFSKYLPASNVNAGKEASAAKNSENADNEASAANEPQAENKVLLRKWTIGEIVTAAASSGLFIKALQELPNLSSDSFDKGIPKTFLLAAERI